jgi:hypothetical protein
MFDTVALSRTYHRPPDFEAIELAGGILSRDQRGNVRSGKLNGPIDSKLPRITFSSTYWGDWTVGVEVSVPQMLFGSNVEPAIAEDIPTYIAKISEFMVDRTGLPFDAWNARVRRVDFTTDIFVSEEKIPSIIMRLDRVTLPKYDRIKVNDTTIKFRSRAKKSRVSQELEIYAKLQERIDRNGTEQELENCVGRLRIERKYLTNQAVSRLAASVGLDSHSARNTLSRAVYDAVVIKTMDNIGYALDEEPTESSLQKLATVYGTSKAQKLAGHLLYKDRYGERYNELPFINLSLSTLKGYDRSCRKAGVVSIE